MPYINIIIKINTFKSKMFSIMFHKFIYKQNFIDMKDLTLLIPTKKEVSHYLSFLKK